MSQAPNLPTLFDFEGQFEDAAQAILVASGIAAYISQEALKMPLLSTGIAFDVGPALDELNQLPKPSNWPADTAAPQDYFRYTGSIEFSVSVPRDDDDASLPGVQTLMRQIRGQIRAAMMRVVFPFNDTNLPYLRVTDIRPAGASTSTQQPRNVDVCSMRFEVSFLIQDGAWPDWVVS